MTTRTIARMFDTSAIAHAAVQSLESAGFAHDDITYMGNRSGAAASTDPYSSGLDRTDTAEQTGAGTGATLGTVVGGGAGLLAGLGALAIPGVGPVVAAGWLIATLTGAGVGAATGGLLGALTSAGVSDDAASTYTEGVRRGGHLVLVRTTEARAAEAELILQGHNPVDMTRRQDEWGASGTDAAAMPADPVLAGVPGSMTQRIVETDAATMPPRRSGL